VPGVGKSTLIESLRAKATSSVYLEEPRDYPFLELFLAEPRRWAFSHQIQFIITKLRQQARIKIERAPALQEMDALASHHLWTPALRSLGWISATEEHALEDLFALAHSPELVSIPTHYVILTAPLEALQRRTTERGRGFETPTRDFVRLLGALHDSLVTFTSMLPASHLVLNNPEVPAGALDTTLHELAEALQGSTGWGRR
jgi:deoxyadenosine/deoxycytidine kinase